MTASVIPTRQILRTVQGGVRWETQPLGELHPRHLRVRTYASAVSIGTELTMLRASPEGTALGYSASGVVEAVGTEVRGFAPGDRVAVYGAPYVHHASHLEVPITLSARVPGAVSLEAAAFGGIGAIAVHGVRQAKLSFGERALVVGLGPIGHLSALILEAAGIDTVCVEPEPRRRMRARAAGLRAVAALEEAGDGFDAALLTAHGPDSLLDATAQRVRLRGALVVVGDLPVNAARGTLFARELSVSVSRAGGPGRYDPQYEREAHDYPLAYVRWTEGRNLELAVRWMERRLNLSQFVTHTYPAADAARAYAELDRDRAAALGVLMRFGAPAPEGEP
ncbi:threonine dehydrogenase-like Zn-dependent dehydrogenase [Deinobacterium chartae]|uniref:Threonine dehydrogenase-like Zn-dependent dehydrogenase n=1 Tax=Deinobacterium chartae TaxID=521158 RepID=A0A841HVH5_9DEIO|nr:zinc-binding alcohol dehydrogenase [Deinobacterium chartae]MBB6097501.1 threonine dehydrogenase-like Zn-dependent dehydrogenase [Deinobacterium chartae]